MRTGTRRRTCRPRGVALVAACTVAAASLSPSWEATADREEPATVPHTVVPARVDPLPVPAKPNIVLITADDMRPDDIRAMPFTKSFLRRRGVTFTDAISPHNTCCPARAEIITGQHGHNSGVMGNDWPNGGYWSMKRPDSTLPQWLQQAGYRTGFVGKYLNGYGTRPPNKLAGEGRSKDETPPGWTRWWGSVTHIYGYTEVTLLRDVPNEPKARVHFDEYQLHLFTRIARNMIRKFHDSDHPFFVWLSTSTPHGVVNPARGRNPIPEPKYADLYPRARPTDPHWNARFHDDTSDNTGEMHGRRIKDMAEVLDLHRNRLRALRSLDDSVRRLVDKLADTGELDDTIIIFTSDNGFALGEHHDVGKDLPYEAMLGVPMIVAAPGLGERYDPASAPGDRVTSRLTVTTLDIPSTIVKLAKVHDLPWPMEGVNMMVPSANPDFGDGVRGVLLQAGRDDQEVRTDVRRFAGIRTDRWTYFGWDGAVRTRNGVRRFYFNVDARFTAETGWRELYNRLADPTQITNDLGDYPTVTRKLHDMLRAKHDCRGAGCVWEASTK